MGIVTRYNSISSTIFNFKQDFLSTAQIRNKVYYSPEYLVNKLMKVFSLRETFEISLLGIIGLICVARNSQGVEWGLLGERMEGFVWDCPK